MLFSSIPFLYYFLPLVLVCYFCVPFRWKNFILLFFSLIFYSWGEPRYIFLMVLSILLGYIEGILIERKKHSRLILAGACCILLGLLMYFKYIDFLIGNLNAIGLSIPLFHIALPIGISFYTFQILSYLIDVYRKDCTAQTNLISFGAYVSMFPQLIAGPIVRYKDIAAQLEVRKHSVEKAALGIRKYCRDRQPYHYNRKNQNKSAAQRKMHTANNREQNGLWRFGRYCKARRESSQEELFWIIQI